MGKLSNNFTVIQGCVHVDARSNKIERALAYSEMWQRQYLQSMLKASKNSKDKFSDLSQDVLRKIGFAGIKYMGSFRDVKRYDKENIYNRDNHLMFSMMDFLFEILENMTLKTFVNTFPITKDYDGHKWDSKDYFFTMDVLSKMDWDKPIGKGNISDLLWDYQNDDLREAYVEYMCIVNALYREQNGKGIGEKFCEDNGIGSYTINNETGVVRDNQTGHTTRLKKRSQLQIVK